MVHWKTFNDRNEQQWCKSYAMNIEMTLDAKRRIVGVGDMIISNDPNEYIVTYALGSCLGVAIYDPMVKIGGILHAMLPDASIHNPTEDLNPAKFVNTGLPHMFKMAYELGAQKEHIIVKLAGCSQLMGAMNYFNIGKRNYAAACKLLWKNKVIINAEHCNKSDSVTLLLDIGTGETLLRVANRNIPF